MDSDAIVLGLASCPGPDWLKEIKLDRDLKFTGS